jgi:hypothetical protein
MEDLSIRCEDIIKVDIKKYGFQDIGRLIWLRVTSRLLINHTESFTNLVSLFSLLEPTGWSSLLSCFDEVEL